MSEWVVWSRVRSMGVVIAVCVVSLIRMSL